MRNNYSTKVRNKKKRRKTTTLAKRRHMKGGNVAKNVLFIGVGANEKGTDYLRLKQGLIANEINFATYNIYLLDQSMNLKDGFAPRDNIKGLIEYNMNDVDELEPNFKFYDESNLFDIIILDYGVYYFIDINKLKKFFNKWLKPGGYFLIPDIINKNAYAIKLPSMPKTWDKSEQIKIFAKRSSDGIKKSFWIHKGQQIGNIKRTILDSFNIPQEDLYLWNFSFAGKRLDDDNKLVEDYHINTESTIHLIENSRPKYSIEKLQEIFSSYKCQVLPYDGTVKAPRPDEEEYKLLKCTKNVTDYEQERRAQLDRELKIASETPASEEYDYSWPGGRKITKKSKKRKSKFKKQSRKK